MSLIYILFAILGLGFLVFIHELGHYWVARRNGMRVEAFAIGFGKPLFTWIRDGVKWHICMLPFGGYVKIAGMQKEGGKEPSEIPDGFFGKKPWQRIQVALAGPLVNIVFALFAFTALWLTGGRDKPFSEFTHRIGWVDPKSALFSLGVRPGDVIEAYDGRPFTGFKDLLLAGIMNEGTTQIQGVKIDEFSGEKTPFNYTLNTYENPEMSGKNKIHTIGVLSPARYLIYSGQEFIGGSPMSGSGIQPKDRVLWVSGEIVYSHSALSSLVNESSAYLTVKREGQIFHTKVPRVQISDLKLTLPEKGEIDDWQHEAKLKGRLQDLYFIPYNLSPSAVVEAKLGFVDEEDQKKAFEPCVRCESTALQEGDEILAVDGERIDSPSDLLSKLQTRHVLMIVLRDPEALSKTLWTEADGQFDSFNREDLQKIISAIGTDQVVSDSGKLHLLSSIQPKPLSEFGLTEAQKGQLTKELSRSRKEAESMRDPQKRSEALLQIEQGQKRLILGLSLIDREVRYNPTPVQQFSEVFKDTYRTLASLLTGVANPKYVAGPVGIVQIVQQSWMLGVKEALFWMALISLNLGIINLLPLPVLDGGHIVFSFIELVTKKPLKAKTMERLIIPFVALLIGFFIFVTYNDITRLFSKFF